MAQPPIKPLTINLRGNEHWVDCTAANQAYDRARKGASSAAEFNADISVKPGYGALGRILGREGKRDASLAEFSKVTDKNIREFCHTCGILPTVIHANEKKVQEWIDDVNAQALAQAADVHDNSIDGDQFYLTVIPVSEQLTIDFGTDKNTENGRFIIQTRWNLISKNRPFTLISFVLEYFSNDGCECAHGLQHVYLNGSRDPERTSGNYALAVPFFTERALQIACKRVLYPPLMIEEPADCEAGDIRLRIRIAWDPSANEAELLERFFTTDKRGKLRTAKAIREVPVLSDSALKTMLSKNLITESDYCQAMSFDAHNRYHIARYPHLYKSDENDVYRWPRMWNSRSEFNSSGGDELVSPAVLRRYIRLAELERQI